MREERRLKVFENRALRRIFGSKRDEATGEWRKLHSEELNDSVLLIEKSRRMGWAAGHVVRMGLYRVLVGKPVGRRAIGRPRRKWKDNIKMNLRKWDVEDMDWIELAQDRDWWRALVNAVMKLRVA